MVYQVCMPEAGIRRGPLVLKTSPHVLSLGKRVTEGGSLFRWCAGESLVMISPSGDEIPLELKHSVPMLNSVFACHAIDLPKDGGAELDGEGDPPLGGDTRDASTTIAITLSLTSRSGPGHLLPTSESAEAPVTAAGRGICWVRDTGRNVWPHRHD